MKKCKHEQEEELWYNGHWKKVNVCGLRSTPFYSCDVCDNREQCSKFDHILNQQKDV